MVGKRPINIMDMVAIVLLALVIVSATFWLASFIAFDNKFYLACLAVAAVNVVAVFVRKYWRPSVIEEVGIGLAIIVALLLAGFYDWAFFAFFCIYCWFIIRLVNWFIRLQTAKKLATCIPAVITLLASGVLGYWATGKMIGL